MWSETAFMSLARDVTTVGGATLASRLLAFLRDMGIAALLGAGVAADAFFAVLQVTNVFRHMLAEGALNAAFVPMWARIKHQEGEAAGQRFFQQVLGAVLLAVVALMAIGLVFAPTVVGLLMPGFDAERATAATDYLRITAPYVGLAGLVAVLAALLSAQGRAGAVGLGIVTFNLVLLAGLAWASLSGKTPAAIGAILAYAVVLAGLGQLLVAAGALLRLRRGGLRPRFGLSRETAQFFALAGPGLLAAGMPQIKLIAGALVASRSEAAVSWLYYANRLYELPLGVISIVIAAVMAPLIATSLRAAEPQARAQAQSRAFEIALALALPASLAFALLAHEIAGALFERGAFEPADTSAVAAALAAIAIGLPGHAIEKVLGAVSFSHEDARTPMLAALAALATAIVGSLALFPRFGHVGVAAAIGGSGWVGALLLGAVLARRRWLRLDHEAWRRLPRIVGATAAMGLALLALKYAAARLGFGLDPVGRVAALAVLVAAGLAVYAAALQVLGVARLGDLLAAARQRL
jgi:putative peptidoglycan lipid II flippase